MELEADPAYNRTMPTSAPWDWPPPKPGSRKSRDGSRKASACDAQMTAVNVEISVTPASRQRSIADKVADIYTRIMVTIVKVILATICTTMVIGSIWLGTILIKAALN